MRIHILFCLAVLIPCIAQSAAPDDTFATKYDTKAPIEIASDSLEVMQEQGQALFTGNVVVIQGKVRLKANKMTITYAKQADAKANTSKKPEGSNVVGSNAVKKIDAEGSVFLSTPDETASGSRGVYDVENQEIRLQDNVVLTRGKNVLKGANLVYDFAAGKSRITGSENASDGKGKGRVRALFVPEKK